MRIASRLILIVALLAIHLSVAYAVLHPKVTPEYRVYFIDRNTRHWALGHYPATPEQGIDLAHDGLPDFVDYSYGMANQEAFGRWTDTELGLKAGFRFRQSFRGPMCLKLRMGPAPSLFNHNVTLRFGNEEKSILLNHRQMGDYVVEFDGNTNADFLEFVFPAKLPPVGDTDQRELGVALARIQMLPRTCSAVQK